MSDAAPALGQYSRFIRRQGWLIVLVPALALASAAFFVSRQHSVYRASMGILVAQAGGPFIPQLGNRPLTQTMTNILESDVIALRVVRKLNLPISSSDLLKKIRVGVKPDSSILEVSYDSPDKQEAVKVLSQFGIALQALIREQLGVSGSRKQPGSLRIVASIFNPPHLEPHRVSPRPGKVLGFAGVLGFALGLILAFARESLDDRVRGRRDAEEWFGAPVIGALPPHPRAQPTTEGGGHRREQAAEALDLLRANVQLRAGGMGPAVLVTSALEHEGTTSVVANLGVALALAGQDVVCVETDLRRPNLQRLLAASERPQDVKASPSGLVDVLAGNVGLADALQEVELLHPSSNGATSVARGLEGRLMLLPAGASPSNPAAVLSPERLSEVARELAVRASYVLFDSPPLLSVGNAFSLALAVDDVLVVAREGRTRRARAQAVRATLEALGARKVAVVLVDASKPLSTGVTQ